MAKRVFPPKKKLKGPEIHGSGTTCQKNLITPHFNHNVYFITIVSNINNTPKPKRKFKMNILSKKAPFWSNIEPKNL